MFLVIYIMFHDLCYNLITKVTHYFQSRATTALL